MFITVEIQTDNPNAFEQVRAQLEANPPDRDISGRPHDTEVTVIERTYPGMAPRRSWTAEYDGAENNAGVKAAAL